ncbi:MAG: hypothetical protein KDA69_10980, partial [Planctomycetaceae bacterium]|nr:hypothetical protein [Planctomycetaceae bacterium]
LHIVESGTGEPDQPVELGTCVVDELPANLPIGTPIEVTIRYDAQARVHVEAKELGSGKSARTTIVRRENVAAQSVSEVTAPEEGWASLEEAPQVANATSKTVPQKPIAPAPAAKSKSVFVPAPNNNAGQVKPKPAPATKSPTAPVASPARKAKPASRQAPKVNLSIPLEEADRPIPLCNQCGEPLDLRGNCGSCSGGSAKAPPRRRVANSPAPQGKPQAKRRVPRKPPQ